LWNSLTNPNGYCDSNCNCDSNRHTDGNRNADRDRDGHTDRNCNEHGNSYSYAQTYSNPATPTHTKATSDPTASSVTGKPRLEKSKASEQTDVIPEKFLNQEMRNPLSRKENFRFLIKSPGPIPRKDPD
jgi:hypothetical protein